MARDNASQEIRELLRDPDGLVHWLGLGEKTKRQQRGVMICCPVHAENNPSCSVRLGTDGTVAVRCHGCGFTGDGFTLIAAVHGLDSRRDFRRILEYAADFTGYDLGSARERPPAAPPPRRELPPPTRAPVAELRALWSQCVKPTHIHPVLDEAALMFLVKRKLSLVALSDMDLVRVMPPGNIGGPWSWWPTRWRNAWRLFIRAYDKRGDFASVQARAIGDVGDGPKTRWPYECSASGLLFGNRKGVLMLRGTPPPLARVVVVEGMTDTMAMSEQMRDEPVAVLGVTSGSAAVLREIPWPASVPIRIETDQDQAGNRYAEEIAAALPEGIPADRFTKESCP